MLVGMKNVAPVFKDESRDTSDYPLAIWTAEKEDG